MVDITGRARTHCRKRNETLKELIYQWELQKEILVQEFNKLDFISDNIKDIIRNFDA